MVVVSADGSIHWSSSNGFSKVCVTQHCSNIPVTKRKYSGNFKIKMYKQILFDRLLCYSALCLFFSHSYINHIFW